MNLQDLTTDQATLEELGTRLARRRIALRMKQADLAKQAGVGKRTIERIESGESCQLTSWIRVLRVLELLPALDAMLPDESVRPVELLRHRGKTPKRVRNHHIKTTSTEGNVEDEWHWGDE